MQSRNALDCFFEPIASVDVIKIFIRQLHPLLFYLASELLPVLLDGRPIHSFILVCSHHGTLK